MNFPKVQAVLGLDTEQTTLALGRLTDLIPFNSDTRNKGAAFAARLEALLEGKPIGEASWGDEPAGPALTGAAAGEQPTAAGADPPAGFEGKAERAMTATEAAEQDRLLGVDSGSKKRK